MKKLLVLLWILLSFILPACSSLTPEERTLRIEDREFQKQEREAQAVACADAGRTWLADHRNGLDMCVSKEDYRRWLDEFKRQF